MTMTLQRAPAVPRRERDALRGVAGADRPDAVGELVGRQPADGVVGAADLEGADRLQRFELEEDLGAAGGVAAAEADERRADGGVVDAWPPRGSCRGKCVGCATDDR